MTYWKFSLTLEVCSFKAWTCFFRWQFFAALKVISTFFGRYRNFKKMSRCQRELPSFSSTTFTLCKNQTPEKNTNLINIFVHFFCKYYTHLMHLRSIIDQCTRSLAYKAGHFFSFYNLKKIFWPQMTNTDL